MMDYFDKHKSNLPVSKQSFESNFIPSGMKPWLENNTILLVRNGSHAYGTNTIDSDLDLKGVAIPPISYFLGFNKVFEQAESNSPYDLVIYDIRKFFKLAADCNPNILEIIFCNPEDHIKITHLGELLIGSRELFLSKNCKHTYSGYALLQLKRMKAHHRWLINPPKAPPTRKEFDLPETTLISNDQLQAAWARVQKRIDTWNMDLSFLDPAMIIKIEGEVHKVLDEQELSNDTQWVKAARVVGLDNNLIHIMDRERRYDAAQKEFLNYQNWVKNRNPKRAALEAKMGYDTKHGSHLVRLLCTCREILEGKGVIVKRPDAAELLEIRNGKMSYEEIVEWAENQDKELNDVMKNSKLPPSVDREKVDLLCRQIVSDFHGLY